MISVHFQGKPFNITVIQVYAPTSNAEEAEVEWFYEDLQDLLEVTPPKDVLFIIGDWNAKVGSQETPGVTDKFGLPLWQRNQRSNCQHPLDQGKKQESSRKTSVSALLTMPKPLTVWITINCGKF